MAYIALYRKYRPEKFADVVGQEHVKRTLMNAIRRDQLSHAYLFSGPRGTGKTTLARILARASNCTNLQDAEPCGVCDNCVSILNGVWGIVEIDGASHNSVDDIRDLQDVIHHVPMQGRYTVYIIDEVHMLTKPAFNAFLKTLEEPPRHARFILATTEPYKLPKTILSRCQHFAFSHISLEQITNQVKKITSLENVKISDDAAEMLALHGRGSMRDTISLLDQAVMYSGDSITLESVKDLLGVTEETVITSIVDAMLDRDSSGLLKLVDDVIVSGQDLMEISVAIIGHLRNLMLIKSGVTSERILGYLGDEFSRIETQAKRIEINAVLSAIEYFSEASGRMKYDIDQRLGLETALLGAMGRLSGFGKSLLEQETVKQSESVKQPESIKPPETLKQQEATKPPVNVPQKPEPVQSEKTSSFPSRQAPPDDKGILRAAKSSAPKTESTPPQSRLKKKLSDDFPSAWIEFQNWLKTEDLPLFILIQGIEANLEKSGLKLVYSQGDKYRYHFGIEDDIPSRLSSQIEKYSDEKMSVEMSFDSQKISLKDDSETLLDPSMSSDVRRSQKVNRETLVRESFLSVFPDGEIAWENDSSHDG
jgi:DNA polymerase-3 subunit gamma/tau